MPKQNSERRVVPLFRAADEEVVPDVRFGARPVAPEGREAAPATSVDLSDKPKLWCLLGAGNTGKAQPDHAPVLTPTGFKPIGVLRVGDLVTCPDGRTSTVIGVFPQGIKPIYRVTFHDGRAAECCDDHLWKVWLPGGRHEIGKSHSTRRRLASGQWQIEPLSKIRSRMENPTKSARKERAIREIGVPLVDPLAIELPPKDLPIPPYTMGALLANGNLKTAHGIRISTPDNYVLEKVEAELPNYEAVFERGSAVDYRLRMRVRTYTSPLRKAVESLGLMYKGSYEKFIPEPYKYGSSAQRLAILQGLMDGDGSLDKSHASITTTSGRLASDIQELVRSLGGLASISKRQTFFTYLGVKKAGRPSWRVNISHPNASALFQSPKKIVKFRQKVKQHKLRISNIEPIGDMPARCIAIDHPEQLYVTSDYIVTHNTVQARWLFERLTGAERSAALFALDPTARSLSAWFEDVEQPGSGENAGRWLMRAQEGLMASGTTTAIFDFGGGGEPALSYCVGAAPDLHEQIERAGIGLVACYCLTARVDDLAVLDRLEEAGFQPQATALLLSPGPESPSYHIQHSAFSAVVRHRAFREAERRGAVPIWIPPLEADVMREIERKRLPFGMAASGQVPEGATFAPIGGLRRPMVARWLERMEEAHKPIATWLP